MVLVPSDPAPSADPLPLDLRNTVDALSERFETCHLVSIADVRDELPRRGVSRAEIDRLIASLADHGISLIEGDAAHLLAD